MQKNEFYCSGKILTEISKNLSLNVQNESACGTGLFSVGKDKSIATKLFNTIGIDVRFGNQLALTGTKNENWERFLAAFATTIN